MSAPVPEMVQRVARAMQHSGLQCEVWSDDALHELARGAIMAMREPSREILDAAAGLMDPEGRLWPYEAWLAMIDAALGATDAAP